MYHAGRTPRRIRYCRCDHRVGDVGAHQEPQGARQGRRGAGLCGGLGRERLVTEGDLPALPYIEAILKETFRLHPVAPTLVPHLAREDASVDGFDIPAGTAVFVSVWSIGRDPALWDAPEEFRPERFIGSKIDVKGQDFELLPFGSGRRMCPGVGHGMKVTLLSIANLLHGFEWRLPDGIKVEELSMEEIFLLAMPRKDPLEAVVEPRLQSHLYMCA